MERPNIVLLYVDQQRWDTIRYAGNPHIHTPHLDQLAQDGVLFDQAFCNNPVCMPSRQSMLSGQYPSTIGCMTNGIEMREDIPILPAYLTPYGYHTANIGKLHFLNHSNRDHRIPHPHYGFDQVIISDEPGCYDDAYIKWVEEQAPDQVENCRCSTPPICLGKSIFKQPRNTHEPYIFEGPEELTHSAFVASETIRYIEQHQHHPFLVIAGFYAPHCPLNPPQRFVDMYDRDSLPLPVMNEGENELGLSDQEWKTVKQYYYALISHVDDQIGQILTTLKNLQLYEKSIILFTSDHGEHLGDHGLIQKGPPGTDSCSRVPLIVSAPGRIKNLGIRQELMEAVDIVPTLIDFCGIQVPPALQGNSFRPLLEGRTYQARPSAYLEFREPFDISWKTIRTQTARYAVNNLGTETLFDLSQDPDELQNIAAQPSATELLQTMRQELITRWFDVEKQFPLKSGAY